MPWLLLTAGAVVVMVVAVVSRPRSTSPGSGTTMGLGDSAGAGGEVGQENRPSEASTVVSAWRRGTKSGTGVPSADSEPGEVVSTSERASIPVASPDSLGPASAESLGLVQVLAGLKVEGGVLNAEQAARWKEALQTLIGQGASAVPAIRDFLRSQAQVGFGVSGWKGLGYPTAREAMLDTLVKIGGPEALGVALEAMQGNKNPREIAQLAQALETLAPEQHRAELLAAARQTLELAKKGELPDQDVGPIFEVLERYGGAEAVADLEEASGSWRYYAVLSLAKLPEGAGIPSLVRMVSESGSPNISALQALAGLSSTHPEARSAMLGQVTGGRITASTWPYLAQALLGDSMQVANSVYDQVLGRADGRELKSTHIRSGNQTIYRTPTTDTLTPEKIRQQLALVDEFMGVAGSDAAATKAMQSTRAQLERRLTRAMEASVMPAPAPAPAPNP